MKIVHVLPALTKGGAERVVVELANHAVANGHEVTVLPAVPWPAHLLADRLRPEVKLRFIQPNGRHWRQAYVRLAPWMLRNRAWLLDQDIIHCHLTIGSVFGTLMQGIRRLSGRRTPAVVETYHAVGMAIPASSRAGHALLLGTRDGAALMAEDPYWKAFLARHPDKPFRIIPNGIAPPPPPLASSAYQAAAGIPDRAFVVGSVGRLVAERRPGLLLDAFARLIFKSRENLHLLLAGDGPERALLAETARDLGISSRVHLPGLATDAAEPLALIDLYWTVNVGPVTGIAALEAAFAGLPIVAVQLDLHHRTTAKDWIWSAADPAQVAEHTAALIADRPAMGALGKKQQAYARAHHSVEAMAAAYERLYDEALALRRAS
ncbi:MAG: glycosyltransferase [Pseudomonadota bacterium]